MIDPFARFSDAARAAAITLITAALTGEHISETAIVSAANTVSFGEVVHAASTLLGALARRLRTPAAMALMEAWFLEVIDDDAPEDPDRRAAAALIVAVLQLPRTRPEDDGARALANHALDNFNDACDAAGEIGRVPEVFSRMVLLWTSLFPEANGAAGVAVLNDVAAELWPDE